MEIAKAIKPCDFKQNETVKVRRCGNVTTVSSTHHGKAYIQRLDKDHYVELLSGEVHDVEHGSSRVSDLVSVRRSLAFGRDMLNANISDVSFCRWLTLTFAENMKDPKKLYFDFANFVKRCRKAYGHFEYIAAAEPQGRGAWHLHVVLIFPSQAPFMPNADVAQLWGKGFVKIKRLDDVDNVGAYLTAYLGDYELQDGEEAKVSPDRVKTVDYEENGEKKSKRYVKGGRLKMYPPGFHIFRFSKGLAKPIDDVMTYKRFCETEKASSGKLTFSMGIQLSSDAWETSINYEYYNKLKAESQDPR